MSSFLDPAVTPEEQAYWLGTPPSGDFVSRWPTPGSNRTDARFRQIYGATDDSTAMRYLLKIVLPESLVDPVGHPALTLWVDMDLARDGTSSTLIGETGFQSNGIKVQMTIFSDDPPFDPRGPGVFMLITLLEDGGGSDIYQWSYFLESNPWLYKVDPQIYPPTAFDIIHSFFGWPSGTIEIWSVADCFSFPRLAPEVSGAVFNGVDSYIGFPSEFQTTTGNLLIEFEINPAVIEELILTGRSNNGSFYTRFQPPEQFVFYAQPIFVGQPLTAGVWQTVRIERGWTSGTPNLYEVFVNDIKVSSDVSGTTANRFNQFGRRATTVQGNYSLRNWKMYFGSPAAPILISDLPFLDDACDLANPTQKGTTFNMLLPSCP